MHPSSSSLPADTAPTPPPTDAVLADRSHASTQSDTSSALKTTSLAHKPDVSIRAGSSSNESSCAPSIVLPWEFDCSLPATDGPSRRSLGAHPYAAFADADDTLFTGILKSVTRALQIALVPPDSPNPSSLRDFLTSWRRSSTAADARVAEVIDAHLMLGHDDVTPLSAAVHSFISYASSPKSATTELERRLCQALKNEVYCHYSVLSFSHVPLPVFPPDSVGNPPCVRLVGVEFSSLPSRRLGPPHHLLVYSRSYHHLPNSPENFTFIDVYDTVTGDLQCLLKTCCISGHIVSASVDFSLKVIACIAASESTTVEGDTPSSQESAIASASATMPVAPDASAAYWSHQSSAALASADPSCAAAIAILDSVTTDEFSLSASSPSSSEAPASSANAQRDGKVSALSLRVDVNDSYVSATASEAPALSRSNSGNCGMRQQFDYRTFVWSFRNAGSFGPDTASSNSHPADIDDLQLEWYDEESLFSKTCNIIPLTNAAPILLRLRQEEFVIVSGREKLRRLATEKEKRECSRLQLPSLILDQIFVDKPPPNRVLPYPCDAAPDGVLASRVLFYHWFPCEFQLLVVSVLKSAKAHDVYDKAMRETQNPQFVALSAIVRLFRFDMSSKKGRPTLVQLLSDNISIKWPNLAMQERSRRKLSQHITASASGTKSRSCSSDGPVTPFTPAPPTPSSVASNSATILCAADGHSGLPPCVNIQVQRRVEESTQTNSVMIFQQLMKPPPDQSKFNFGRRHSLPEKVARFKVVVFTISQAPQPAPPRTTFVKPTIRVDDSLSRNVDWFSRLLFACVNGCVIIWLPGSVLTILAMNFTHPCIGGFTLDAFRHPHAFPLLLCGADAPSFTRSTHIIDAASELQNSILSFDVNAESSEADILSDNSRRMIFPSSHMQLQAVSISFRALMLVAEAYPSTLPLMLHIFAINMQVPDRTIKAFFYHVLECNPQHITAAFLKEYLTVIPLVAVEAAAAKLLNTRTPWSDIICMPFTSLIQKPSLDEEREFELKMTKRCGSDFNRNLALSLPLHGEMSKRGILTRCRIAIMSIRNEKSGGKSATLKELHEVFGRSAVYLGCGELQSGLKSYLPAFLSSNKKMPLGASASIPGFSVSFNDDWAAKEWAPSGSAVCDKVSDRVKLFFKSMKSFNDDRRSQLSKVYTMTVRSSIQEICGQCSKHSGFERAFSQLQSDAASDLFSFDPRKEIALRELICAVADLDELFPPNFMKSHFNVMYRQLASNITVPHSGGAIVKGGGSLRLWDLLQHLDHHSIHMDFNDGCDHITKVLKTPLVGSESYIQNARFAVVWRLKNSVEFDLHNKPIFDQMRMVLHSLALEESRELHKCRKEMSFCRLVAEIHLAGKLFTAQERPRSEDEEEEDDWLNLGDARFESDIERRYAHSRGVAYYSAKILRRSIAAAPLPGSGYLSGEDVRSEIKELDKSVVRFFTQSNDESVQVTRVLPGNWHVMYGK